jgi:hypothetical protein
VSAKSKLVYQVCGTALSSGSEACPVCALRRALGPDITSLLDSSSELRFEHYHVLKNKDRPPIKLGRGARGITYKGLMSICSAWLSRSLTPNSSATTRLADVLCEKRRASASVRHPNVASVFHLDESGNYFYVMEFAEGETLGKWIQCSGRLEPDLAFEVIAHVAGNLIV